MNANQRDVIDQISAYLAGQSDLRLGLLFGSMADGQPNSESDIDIAVLGNGPLSAARRMELIGELARLSGRAVDLVDLATAGIVVARSAVLHGKVLFSRDSSVYPSQITRVLIDSADFLPYRERMLKERRDAWIRQ